MRNSVSEKAPLVKIAIGLMAGMVAAKYVVLLPLFPLLVGLILIAFCLWRYAYLQSAVIILCFVVLGALLMQQAQQEPPQVSKLERSRNYFLSQRARLLDRLSENGVDGNVYAVVAAMTLGDKSQLTKELRETYTVTGAAHVLALSGLHLSIIYTLLSLFFCRQRWQIVSQVLIVISIWLFVFLVGMSSSVVRSAVMLTVYALLSLGDRNRISVNTLAFTAIIMLMVHPLSLFDIGFQLSFLAVLSILIWYPVFEGVIPQSFLMSHRLVRWLWSLLAVSCAAQLGTAPLIAYYFGRFSSLFLITNLVVLPFAPLIIYLTLAVLFIPSLAYILVYIVSALNGVLTFLASIPWVSIEALHPSILQIMMIYVIIAATYLLIDRLPGTSGLFKIKK